MLEWLLNNETHPFHGMVGARDVPGKEREKTGTAKKWERNAFFPFPFLHFWAPVFFPFLAKIVKNG